MLYKSQIIRSVNVKVNIWLDNALEHFHHKWKKHSLKKKKNHCENENEAEILKYVGDVNEIQFLLPIAYL